MATALPVMLLAGCAANDAPATTTAAEDGRDCFFLSQVNGFSDAGKNRVNVNVGPGRTYEFETFGSCPELNYSLAIAFDQKGPGTICKGMDVDLIVPSSIGPQRCPVRMIRRVPEKP
ncbi:MAG: hypothetical protein KDE32_06465 [Novosphingobium sp.]|nr:hypothetical protein [Novosphingobium sp.]